MKKYKESLLLSIKIQFAEWFDHQDEIENEEVARFLHTIKGTAGTIGLAELSVIAESLLDKTKDHTGHYWDPGKLRAFLYPLIKESYENIIHEDELLTQTRNIRGEEKSGSPLLLILEDDVALLMFLKEELEKLGWIVLAAVEPNKAVDYLHDMNPDCIMLDMDIAGHNGFEFIETLTSQFNNTFLPIIAITSNEDRETRLKCYQLGADDLLIKPFAIDELIIRLQCQLKKKERLDKVLWRDELSGAFNRNYLESAYEKQILECKKWHEILSIAILDLDRFKKVNDRYGHAVGDQVLAGFAQFMKNNIRWTDLLIRYGGEEFVLIMPRTKGIEAKYALEQLLAKFSQHVFESGGEKFKVSFSAGVVEVTNLDLPLEYWFKRADNALYCAKGAGRSRVEIADTESSLPFKKQIKVAIIDDDAIIRTLLTESVKEYFQDNIEVDISAYRDGLAFFEDPWFVDDARSHVPYLLILDGMLPRMDGIEVLKRIRNSPRSDQFMIVMLTGRKSEQDIVKALHLGADDYITKPFNMNELEARIKRLIQRMN